MMKFYLLFILTISAIIVQAQFTDDFESYTAGAYLAQSSPAWTTWSNNPGSTEDVQVTTIDSYSGSNSIYFSSTSSTGGPQDVVLPFGGSFNTGDFIFEQYMKVQSNKGAYFNFQANTTIGQEWALDFYFVQNGNLVLVSDQEIVLITTYPMNTWFKLTLDINLNTNEWELLIDGVSKGTFVNNINRVASIDYFPVNDATFGGNNQAGFFVDDVYFNHTPYTLPARNGAMISSTTDIILAGDTAAPAVEIRNLGSQPITSFDIVIDYNGNQITQSFSGLNISSLSYYTATLSQDIVAAAGNNILTATITNVNGQGTDDDPSDDSKTFNIDPIVPAPGKIVVAEEATGTWCGWCPRGTVAMAFMQERFPQYFAGIAVHNNDPMEDDAYDNAINGYIGGYPSALVNRASEIDPSEIPSRFIQEITDTPSAMMTHSNVFDPVTRELAVNVITEFQEVASGNWRLALVLTENGVTGSSSGYAQQNYYSYQSQNLPLTGAGKDWQAAPHPVPASQMVYDHVARMIYPSFTGMANSFPTSVNIGDTFHHQFIVNVDPGWNENNMHAVTLLIKPNGRIDNAGMSDISSATIGVEDKEKGEVKTILYPNPASEAINIEMDLPEEQKIIVLITDITGKVLKQSPEYQWNGKQHLTFDVRDLSAGVYFVNIKSGNTSTTHKVVIQ